MTICKKKSFNSEEEALRYRKIANKRALEREKGIPKNLRTFKRLTHAYQCVDCKKYHLTSMTNTGLRKMKERALYKIRYK